MKEYLETFKPFVKASEKQTEFSIRALILGILLSLLFAIGLYLPISLNTAIMFGGLVCLITKRIAKSEKAIERGILISSGLVAGDACMGVLVALLTVTNVVPAAKVGWLGDGFSLLFFVLLSAWLGYRAVKTDK